MNRWLLPILVLAAGIRFGYQEEDPEGHRRDLEKVKPLLDEPLDIEVKLYNLLSGVSTPLKGLGQYQSLHWNLKSQFSAISNRNALPRHLTNHFEVT